IPEGAPRVHVVAAGPRQHDAQLRQAGRSQKRVESSNDPHGENRGRRGELGGDQTGRPQDADAERAADDDREAEADAENASKPGAGADGHFNATSTTSIALPTF